MATREQFKLSASERKKRHFSENFKREKVREIELGVTSVAEVRKTYDVSFTSIYKWRNKFGTINMKEKRERLIVESQSDAVQLRELKKRIAELERAVGQKQLLIDFHEKMIELAEEEYGIDIKKKFSGGQSNTTGSTEK